MPADAPSDLTPVPPADPPGARPDRTKSRMGSRERRRKWLILLLLIALLAALSYAVFFFTQNKRLPIPGLAPAAAAIEPPSYLFSITGSGANQLRIPVGVTVGRDGRVYVVDFGRRRIAVFNRAGRFLFAFNTVSDGTYTELGNPVHLATAKDGTIWVTDRRNKAIYVFSPEGKYLRRFEPSGQKDFDWTPLALAFGDNGELRVTDVGNTQKHRVLYFDSTGKLTAQFGSTVQVKNPDESPGNFYFPNGLAVSRDGRVYVSDGDNRRMQVFDDTGKFEQFVNTSGVPRGTAIDSEKRLYVVDALAHQVDIYNLKGEQLTQFGQQGFGPGQFNYPNDVTIDGNRIYVTDRQNDQVQVWGWPVGAPPAIRLPRTPLQWLLCLSPLLLLPLLLLLRRRRFTVTEDFVDAMIAEGATQMFGERRFRFVVPEAEHSRYEGRVEDGVNLGEVIAAETHSASDARVIQQRLEIDEASSILLAIAQRTKGLCTQDEELRRLAVMLEIDVYDAAAFVEHFSKKRR